MESTLLATADPMFRPILQGWNTNTPAEVADVLLKRFVVFAKRISEREQFETWLRQPGNFERLRQAVRDRRRLCRPS
jgi:hypothetical protein